MPTSETEQLAALIDRRHACLSRLREMGRRQLELIEQDRIAELLDVLGAKQSFLAELQRTERALAPFRSQSPDSRTWGTPERRRHCAETAAGCERLLAEIIEQEKRAESDLIRRRDAAAEQLRGTHVAGQARRAYTARTRPGINRVNLLSEG